jgi:hypothetical protein
MPRKERRIRRVLLRNGALTILAALGLLVAGCGGSSDDDEDTTTPPPAVAPAQTQAEWIDRLVNRFLIDMNKDLQVANTLATPQVRVYLRSGNPQTLSVLRTRMNDLNGCSRKLGRVGPPPAQSGPLVRIYTNFRQSCPHYERLAQAVLTSIPLISSRDAQDVRKGEAELAKAFEPSREAARYYGAAVQILQRNGLLQAYGG